MRQCFTVREHVLKIVQQCGRHRKREGKNCGSRPKPDFKHLLEERKGTDEREHKDTKWTRCKAKVEGREGMRKIE